MGLDHIKELLSGRRSSRHVLIVSDLVSFLEVLVMSAVGLTGPNLDGLFFSLALPQSILYICPLPWLAIALRPVGRHGWDRTQTCF